jgi:hypothetical protein
VRGARKRSSAEESIVVVPRLAAGLPDWHDLRFDERDEAVEEVVLPVEVPKAHTVRNVHLVYRRTTESRLVLFPLVVVLCFFEDTEGIRALLGRFG